MKSLKLFFIVCSLWGATITASGQGDKFPTSQAEIEKMATRARARPLGSLSDPEKIKQVEFQLQGRAVTAAGKHSLSLPVRLDPRNSVIEGKAKLDFLWPSFFSAGEDVVHFPAGFSLQNQEKKIRPGVEILYNASSPGYYVFDFTIEAPAAASVMDFRNGLVDFQQKPLSHGMQHQLLISNIKTAGWNWIRVQIESSGWEFYSVEISQFK